MLDCLDLILGENLWHTGTCLQYLIPSFSFRVRYEWSDVF